jgi:hypothetical protein
MSGTTDRFEVVIEPTDCWFVWDTLRNLPAEHAGLALFGLTRSQALMYCQMLNAAEPVEHHVAAQATPRGGQDVVYLTQK